jgi:proline iminopeptidase
MKQGLYPAITPFDSQWLQVDSTHEIYLEQSGNPQGKPVLFVHGGPGAGTSALCRRFFNPEYYRIILVDQRGCGQSRPFACLDDNTTSDLIADFEKIRQHLQIDCWMLFGGSWGSTLALAYGQAVPEVVTEIILRGIFLARQQDFDWLYRYGASEVFPEAWAEFIKPVSVSQRGDILAAYGDLLYSSDKQVVSEAARSWSQWEAKVSTLEPDVNLLAHFSEGDFSHALARIEHHYFSNSCFLTENQLLEQAGKLQKIPMAIVHGRYDMCCALRGAWDLHQALPHANMHVVPSSGHAMSELGIAQQLVACADTYTQQ